MKRCTAFVIAALAAAAMAACSSEPKPPAGQTAAPAPPTHVPIGQLPMIDIDGLLAHTRTLSSDAYEGRAPGTKGEELSVAYIADQFRQVGLKPGMSDGTYFQKVPLVGITSTPTSGTF